MSNFYCAHIFEVLNVIATCCQIESDAAVEMARKLAVQEGLLVLISFTVPAL